MRDTTQHWIKNTEPPGVSEILRDLGHSRPARPAIVAALTPAVDLTDAPSAFGGLVAVAHPHRHPSLDELDGSAL